MKKEDLVEGGFYEVTANKHGHGFDIGEIIVLKKIQKDSLFLFERLVAEMGKRVDFWWCLEDEVKQFNFDLPTFDADELAEDFEFHCGYSSDEAVRATEKVYSYDLL